MKKIRLLEGERHLLLEECPLTNFMTLTKCKACKHFIDVAMYPAIEWKQKGPGHVFYVFCGEDEK